MDSQDAEYADDRSSEESMEEDAEDAEDAEDDLLGDYGAQRRIETEYEFVESQPSVISLSNTPAIRSWRKNAVGIELMIQVARELM